MHNVICMSVVGASACLSVSVCLPTATCSTSTTISFDGTFPGSALTSKSSSICSVRESLGIREQLLRSGCPSCLLNVSVKAPQGANQCTPAGLISFLHPPGQETLLHSRWLFHASTTISQFVIITASGQSNLTKGRITAA